MLYLALGPLEGLKVAQKGTQPLPEPRVRVCTWCSKPVQVYPTIVCPNCGDIPANCVVSIRKV